MAANVPIDAWAKVFKFLEPSPDWHSLPRLQDGDTHQTRDQQDALGPSRMQATFWQLPAVCKTFQRVLNKHSGLGCHIFCDTKLARKPLFLDWLQLQAAKVHSMTMVCEPYTGPHYIAECLRALLHPSSVLASISLTAHAMPKLDLLAQFTSLTACSFVLSCTGQDLAPLVELRNLTSLSLQGRCRNLSLLGHLTYLDLDKAHLFDQNYDDQIAPPFSSLIELQLKNSQVYVQKAGLHSCTRLKKLVLHGTETCCEFLADDNADQILHCASSDPFLGGYFNSQVPYRISYLVHMTDVQLHFSGQGQNLDLTGICDLPSLKALDIVAPGQLEVSCMFERLSQLTKLWLSVDVPADKGRAHGLNFSMDGEKLASLQQLRIRGTFSVSGNFVNLARLKELAFIEFLDAHSFGSANEVAVAALLHDLRYAEVPVYVPCQVPYSHYGAVCPCILCNI